MIKRAESTRYTILYKETVSAAKPDNRAISRINKLCGISDRWVFGSNSHRKVLR